MSEEALMLAGRIRADLIEIDRLVGRISAGWLRANKSSDDLYLDSVALNLHGIYTAVEGLFERIASIVDEKSPTGENWHKLLLEQMSSEIAGVRPAVISIEVKGALDELRGFRHVARNIYTFNLDPAKLLPLVSSISETFTSVAQELGAFADFLEQSS